jgi:hypothetical protein
MRTTQTQEHSMSKVTLDADLRRRLNGLNEPFEVCDERGHTVGHFLPADLYEELFYTALAAESPHSKEELKRRHREMGGSSLAEIWKRLGRQ